jgi:hypothetical protein
MTDPAPRTPPRSGAGGAARRTSGRRGTVAPASRLVIAGLSTAATCGIVAALALGQPTEPAPDPVLDVAPAVPASAPAPEEAAAPPPTTIVVNRIYVPVPTAGATAPATASGGGGTAPGGGSTPTRRPSGAAVSPAPSASAAAGPAPAPTAAARPAPTTPPTTAAPVARSRAS